MLGTFSAGTPQKKQHGSPGPGVGKGGLVSWTLVRRVAGIHSEQPSEEVGIGKGPEAWDPRAPGETASQPSPRKPAAILALPKTVDKGGQVISDPNVLSCEAIMAPQKNLRNVIMAANRSKALKSSTQQHPLHTDTHTHQNKQPGLVIHWPLAKLIKNSIFTKGQLRQVRQDQERFLYLHSHFPKMQSEKQQAYQQSQNLISAISEKS